MQSAKGNPASIVRIGKTRDTRHSKVILAKTNAEERKVRQRESNLDDVVQIGEGTVGSD
jgi:hypothetical protein